MIAVRGKGNKERLVPLNESSKQAMAGYLAAIASLKAEKAKSAAAKRSSASRSAAARKAARTRKAPSARRGGR